MERPKHLTAAFVKGVKAPGRYGDGRGGHGVSLLVKAGAGGRISKSWSQRLNINGQEYNIGLGAYPVTSLGTARDVALENRRGLADGIDPRTPPKPTPTFEQAVKEVMEQRAASWRSPKTAKRWLAVLQTYAYPTMGHKLISDITSADVLMVLTPVWVGKPEIGKQLREHISVVMDWSRGQGHRLDNPADKSILKSLPKQGRKGHFQALPYAEVGEAIRKVRRTGAYWGTKQVFSFILLTGCRSGEARNMVWDEVDLANRVWVVPAEKMKNRLEHKVPLSPQAAAVLEDAKALTGPAGLVFPSQKGKLMSDSTVSKVLRENEIKTVPHGLRSSFRDWAAESGVPREISELALAHVEGSATETAYRRTDYYKARCRVMDDWGRYVQEAIDKAG